MSKLMLGTNAVNYDEPCFSLKEVNQRRPDSRGIDRYMIVRVVRGDRLVEFRRSLGPASKFTKNEFAIPGGVVDAATGRGELLHTVGELVEIAEYLRSDQRQPERPVPSDLVGAYVEGQERRKLWRWKRSTFGPGGSVQRV